MKTDTEFAITADAFDRFVRHMDQQLEQAGDRLLAGLDDGDLTYALLRNDIQRLASSFELLGLHAGDRALVCSRRERITITVFMALLRAGLTPVVVDSQATPAEITEVDRTCRPRVVLADPDTCLRAGLCDRNLPKLTLATDPSRLAIAGDIGHSIEVLLREHGDPAGAGTTEVAMMVFTSGTTSAPKAVELTHANLMAQMDIFAAAYGFDSDSRLLNVLPLHHVDGLIRGPLAALWFGASVQRTPAFSVPNVPSLLEAISAHRITHFITVPAMLRIVERVGSIRPDAFRTPDFRFVLCSADHLDSALWKRFESGFGIPVVNAYGLSEVVCDALFAGPAANTRRVGSLGLPRGCVVDIVGDDGCPVKPGAVGELVISGPTVMRGYFEAVELTAQVLRNGVFLTGDFFRVAEDGLFEFVGRKKTAIVSAGVTLHPESVAAVLTAMPGVAEAVAFGVPDPARGDRLVAALAPLPGQQITPADAAAFCRAHLSPERVPAEFLIVGSLPRNPAGKVLVKELLESIPTSARGERRCDVFAVAAACFNCPVESLTPESSPFNTDGWDSMAHMLFIEELESSFEFQLSAIEITQIMSLGDAQSLVDQAVAKRRAMPT